MEKWRCEDCDEEVEISRTSMKSASSHNVQYCTVCGSVLVRTEPQQIPVVQNRGINVNIDGNVIAGSWDGLFDIIGDDLREAIEASQLQTSSVRQISVKYLSTLGTLKVDARKTILYEASINIGPLSILAVPASFSWLPVSNTSYSKHANLVLGDPVHGETKMNNSEECKDHMVLLKRGVVSFTTKADRAVQASASVLVVAQSYDMWPFTMTAGDATSTDVVTTEGRHAYQSSIPVVMISKQDSEIITKMMESLRSQLRSNKTSTSYNNSSNSSSSSKINSSGSSNGSSNSVTHAQCPSVPCTLKIGEPVAECSICQEDFAVGDEVLKLACRHLYHAHCVTSWLSQHNTCPLCRSQMPRQAEEGKVSGASAQVAAQFYG